MSNEERTGWRDAELSLRHRDWGYNCPAADLDWVVVEYNLGAPVALIEYKWRTSNSFRNLVIPNLRHATYRACRILADNSDIPYLLVFYDKNPWLFCVHPVNEHGKKWFAENELLSEYDYVRELYMIRSVAIEESVMRNLSRVEP